MSPATIRSIRKRHSEPKRGPTVKVHLNYCGTYRVDLVGAQSMTYAEACALASILGLPRTPDTGDCFD